MRLRWQLALGGAVLTLAAVAVAGACGGGLDLPAGRLDDPLLLLVVAGLGAVAGGISGVLIERPLCRLAAAVRGADADGGGLELAAVAGQGTEALRDLGRALRDLDARQAAAAVRRRDQTRRLEVILDSITEGILVTDPEGRVALTNRALEKLFAVGRPAVGRRPVEVVRDSAVDDAIARVLAGGTPVSCEISLGGAGRRHMEVQVAPLADAGGASGTVAVFHEITNLRRLERMRADFVANVSHELRTPLTAIKGCAETLADGALADAEAAACFVGVICSHADRLTNLLGDLLDLSRLESEQVRIEAGATPVLRMVEAAQSAVSGLAAQRGIDLEVEVCEGLEAHCDRRLVEQALMNLVENSVKYTPEGGRVRIRVRRLARAAALSEVSRRRWSAGGGEAAGEADAVVVEVADSGIGIPSDEVERVFERFYRVDKGRSRAMGGTGLGLSIVRHVVQLHGGWVFVDSQLGQGSVFGFTLEAV